MVGCRKDLLVGEACRIISGNSCGVVAKLVEVEQKAGIGALVEEKLHS